MSMRNFKGVKLSPEIMDNPEVPSWVGNQKFVPVTKLFPNWKNAEKQIRDFWENTEDWIVMEYPEGSGKLHISLQFPQMFDPLSKEYFPMWDIFPKEERAFIMSTCMRLVQDYIPSEKINTFINQPLSSDLCKMIEAEIKKYEQFIIENGGRPWQEELAFRLGIWNESMGNLYV